MSEEYRGGYRISERTEDGSSFNYELWSDRYPAPGMPEYIESRHDTYGDAVARQADLLLLEGDAGRRSRRGG